MFARLGWDGTWLPLIVPHFFANAYNVFLLRQYFLSIPRELDEAAMIDGAGPFRILLSVIVPQALAGDHRGRPVPFLLRLERLFLTPAVSRRASPSCSRCRSASRSSPRSTQPAAADPGDRAPGAGRARRRVPVRPARVHARRGGHRGRQVSAVEGEARRGAGAPRRRRPRRWPVIPAAAWGADRRPRRDAGHPRVELPIFDDGEFSGVPIGGLGTGSIGRTYRGDVARWHLEVGQPPHEPVAADGFSVFVGGPDGSRGHRAVGPAPGRRCRRGAGRCPWAVGRTTRCSRGPGSTSRPRRLGVRLVGEQLSR